MELRQTLLEHVLTWRADKEDAARVKAEPAKWTRIPRKPCCQVDAGAELAARWNYQQQGHVEIPHQEFDIVLDDQVLEFSDEGDDALKAPPCLSPCC